MDTGAAIPTTGALQQPRGWPGLRVWTGDIGNACSETWVTLGGMNHGGWHAVERGVAHGSADRVCGLGAATGSKPARVVSAVRDQCQDRLQMVGPSERGGGWRVVYGPFAPAACLAPA